MKTVLTVLFFLPLPGLAQTECKVIRETDPYTKETKVSSGFISLQGGTLSIEADSKEVDFFFIVKNMCFNDGSTLFIYFDGSKARTTWRNAGGMNCNGYFHYKYRNSTVAPTIVKKMATQKMGEFVFTANDKSQVTVTLTPEQQDILMKTVSCMIEESRKLLPPPPAGAIQTPY